jgi:hypothetical protein
MSEVSNNEQWEDYAVKTVKKLKNEGDIVASLFLCSAFVEHYCRTKLLIFLLEKRPLELIEVKDKITKKPKKVYVFSKMRKIIFEDIRSQRAIIKVGFLVGAWNKEVYEQLKNFNKKRNSLVHRHENILQILDKDKGKKEAEKIIALGLSLLDNIKLGYVKS